MTPFCAQTLEEVERSWLVMREVELPEKVEAISALAQELASELSVGSDETTSSVLCDPLDSTVTLEHLLSGVACGEKATLFLNAPQGLSQGGHPCHYFANASGQAAYAAQPSVQLERQHCFLRAV